MRRARVPITVTITIAFLIGLWEAAVRAFEVPAYLVPPPSAVMRAMIDWAPSLLRHMQATSVEILAGFLMSAALGIPIGVIIVYSRWLEQVSYVLLVISQSVPKVALAPLFLVWIGFGLKMVVLVTFLIAFFPVVIATVVGLRSVHPDMLQLARTLKASQLQTFWHFRLPAALPSIFGGLKVASTLSVVGAIVAEFVGSQEGLGYLILTSNSTFQTALSFASIVLLSVMGLLFFYFLVWLERRVVFWSREETSEEPSFRLQV